MIRWARTCSGGYEVSTKGDKRFSAFVAQMHDGRTIEQWYQCDVKGYDVGGTNWRLGKGKPSLIEYPDLYKEYRKLWVIWSMNNLPLIHELSRNVSSHKNCLTDQFAKTPVNQAHALADILNRLHNM